MIWVEKMWKSCQAQQGVEYYDYYACNYWHIKITKMAASTVKAKT